MGNNRMWLMMAVAYSSGVIEAQVGGGQTAAAGPPQSSMPARTMAQLATATASAPQQVLSQMPASAMAGTAPTDGAMSPQAGGTPPPTTMPSTPQIMMAPPQTRTPAMNSSTAMQRGSNQTKEAPPPTQPGGGSSSNMRQASNGGAGLSQAGSAMGPNTTDLGGGRMVNNTMGEGKSAPPNKRPNPPPASMAKNQTSQATMVLAQETGTQATAPVAAAAASLVSPTTAPPPPPPRNGAVLQPTASPPPIPPPSARLAPADPPTPAPPPPPIIPMESPQPAAVPSPPSPDGMMMSAPPSMASSMTATIPPSQAALPTTPTEGFEPASSSSSSSPDLAQLIATEKFNNDIESNRLDEQKAQALINQLKAASKIKLSPYQLGNQTIFLNSLTTEQRTILESRMKTLSLTATQQQLERNYLATFVSETDRMAHQAGFEAIKKTLTPEAQRAFDPAEGMKSLQQLTEDQKYLFQEGSREFLEDPAARLQAAAAPLLSPQASPLLFSFLVAAAFSIIA